MQQNTWAILEKNGVKRRDPTTWTQGLIRVNFGNQDQYSGRNRTYPAHTIFHGIYKAFQDLVSPIKFNPIGVNEKVINQTTYYSYPR